MEPLRVTRVTFNRIRQQIAQHFYPHTFHGQQTLIFLSKLTLTDAKLLTAMFFFVAFKRPLHPPPVVHPISLHRFSEHVSYVVLLILQSRRKVLRRLPSNRRGGTISRGRQSPADRSREASLIPNYRFVHMTYECTRRRDVTKSTYSTLGFFVWRRWCIRHPFPTIVLSPLWIPTSEYSDLKRDCYSAILSSTLQEERAERVRGWHIHACPCVAVAAVRTHPLPTLAAVAARTAAVSCGRCFVIVIGISFPGGHFDLCGVPITG